MSWKHRLLVAVVLAVVAILAVRWLARPDVAQPEPAASGAAAEAPPAEPTPREAAEPPPSAAEPAPDLALGLGGVDMDEVRAALPDNLYWQTSAPTDDPALLEQRERDKDYRNEQYGKVLSGTGTDEEILDYYDYRMRSSTDYVQFVDHLLEHYGPELTDQDQTLLHLAKRLHQARLEEIPRRLQEARERKAEQDEARRKWLEEEREFRGDADAESAQP
jgi:hypothetical protein